MAFTPLHIHCLYDNLTRDPEAGRFIKSITFIEHTPTHSKEERRQRDHGILRFIEFAYNEWKENKSSEDRSRGPPTKDLSLQEVDAVYCSMAGFILNKAKNLETLRFLHSPNLFPFLERVNGSLSPLYFFAHSLKRIEIGAATGLQKDASARNCMWILIFSTHLEVAVLNFSVTLEDVKYLEEYSQSWKGLSKVKYLAIAPLFESDPKFARWWNKKHLNAEGERRNLKEESIYNFLLVSNQLSSLEIWTRESPESDESVDLIQDCLSALQSSFKTLKHLRLAQFPPDIGTQSLFEFSKFTELKVLAIEGMMLAPLTSWLQYSLPSSLEVIQLLYYCASREQQTLPDFIEDAHVGLLLDNRQIPNLKEVAVPAFPHDISGRAYTSSRQLECWNRSREILKSNEVFKDRKVKLRLLHLGEAGECVGYSDSLFV